MMRKNERHVFIGVLLVLVAALAVMLIQDVLGSGQPEIRRVSVLLDGEVKWETIAQTIRGVKSELFHGAAFVDEYRGKQVPDGKKSVTIRLAIGSKEKTLTSAEIEEVANGVIKKLVKRFGAELRSK